MTRPLFGSREVYDALADALNEDPKWLAKAQVLNYTMTHVYTEPLNKTFTFRFEGGVPVRTSQSAGPIFAERAQTLGRGRMLAGLTRSSFSFTSSSDCEATC